jgi:valyl-tRNA synthetase
MDIRPQGPEIIRTWLFSSLVRSHFEHGLLPWHSATINGWILDPDRKKMSKSRGNVVTPLPLIEEHGAEAVRYWACNGRPGVDTAVDFGVMKIGRRLAIKILNASRFALGFSDSDADVAAIGEALDRSMLAGLAETVAAASAAFDDYDYARALEVAERSFWDWTDDYVELVKSRAYDEGSEAGSAHAALQLALSVYLRLFAPFLPFVTEEVWSWWRAGSVHRAAWPSAGEFDDLAGDPRVFAAASSVLGEVRRVKSDAKLSMRAPVSRITVSGDQSFLDRVRSAEHDILQSANGQRIVYSTGQLGVIAELVGDSDS